MAKPSSDSGRGVAPKPKAAAIAHPVSQTGCLDPAAFLRVLEELIEEDRAHTLRLHVFSLVDFRQALAEKWQRLNRLITIAVPTIARQHINADNDIFSQIDAELSLLAIPHRPRDQVRTCVAAIAQDVGRQLFGDAVINGRRPQVIVTSIPLSSALADDGSLNQQAIDSALAQAGAFLKPVDTPDSLPKTVLAAPHRATLAALMQEPVATASISGLQAPDAIDAPAWYDNQLDVEAKAASRSNGRMSGESKLTLLWTPTWVSAKQQVGAFQSRMVRIDAEGETPLESGLAYQNISPVETLTLDRFVATRTAQELKQIHYANQPWGLIMPIHWLSLAPKWRDCIRLPLQDCPLTARRKHLKIEIFGISPTLPAYMFNYMFDPIEALGCDVLVRLPLASAPLISMLHSVKAVGIDLSELPDQQRVGDDELFRKITHFRNTARNHNLACYIWGVRRRPLIAQMIETGFSFINGPGLMCDLGHPHLTRQHQRAA